MLDTLIVYSTHIKIFPFRKGLENMGFATAKDFDNAGR